MTVTTATVRTRTEQPVDRPAWASVLLAGTTMFVFLDVIRALFPSIAFIYGRAGTTPAGEMGLFAFVLFATAALVARVAGVNATVATPVALLSTMAARIALVVADGGTAQLLAASLGLVAVVALLGSLAASDLPVRQTSRGLAAGLLASLTVHVILGTQDAIWLDDSISWLVAISLVAALAVSWWETRPSAARPDVRTIIPWALIGPIVAFHGIAAGTPGAMRNAWGEGPVLPGTILVAASAAGLVAGRLATSSAARPFAGRLVLLPAGIAAVLLLGSDQAGNAAIAAVLCAFVATLSLTMAGEATDDSLASRGRRSSAPAGGMLVTFLIVFGYYASFEAEIGFPRGLLPAAGVLMVAVLLYQLEAGPDPDPMPTREDMGTVAFAPFLVAFVLLSGQTRVLPPPLDASLGEVRVMAWNIHMGYDNDGRFDPQRIAGVIAAQQPDILVLNEVDRGWLLTGGHDLLRILADELQMEYSFGATADAVWGNAILSRHPILDPQVTLLPGDVPLTRGTITARVQIGGQQLGIIGTHLHHLEDTPEDDAVRLRQVEQIAEQARELQLRSVPVVILGDFNEAPGSPELAPLAQFSDLVALASDGAFVPTWPSSSPSIQIDHVFASPGITASELDVTQTTASDHLPVAVTISLG